MPKKDPNLDGTIPFSILPEGCCFTNPGDEEGIWYYKGPPPYYEPQPGEIPPNAWTVGGQDRYTRFGPAAPVRLTVNPN